MGLITDDTILHPQIDKDVLLYITHLDEGYDSYTRYFDALLIQRKQHRSFFKDLRAFREQPQIIALLNVQEQQKPDYKEITRLYLGSRFAHPWCRKTPLKKGFWRSEWGSIEGKPCDADTVKEEEKLHELLVPIWIVMRSRMFPSDKVIQEWCCEHRREAQNRAAASLTTAALRQHDQDMVERDLPDYDESCDRSDDATKSEQGVAVAATSVLRLAAAGLIISQTPKRKLTWLVKKPK